MKLKIGKSKIVFVLLFVRLCISCSDDCAVESAMRVDAGQLPVILRIPAFDNYSTRTAGDPGDYDKTVNLPTRLYLYVVTEKEDGGTQLTSKTLALSKTNWQPTTIGTEIFYEYPNSVKVDLPSDIALDDRKAIRVYAAATPVAFAKIDAVEATTTEEALCNLTFSLQPDDSGSYDYIRDIYATMADYTVDGEYYGTAQNPNAEIPYISLTLYHVAAKVDVIWNVATAMQPVVRLKQVALAGLRCEDCYLFRPMQNTPPTSNTYQTTVTTDVGTQWLGRHSFYMMPCIDLGNMPLEFHLWQSDDTSADGFEQNINISMTETTFTPWVRQDILISKTLK